MAAVLKGGEHVTAVAAPAAKLPLVVVAAVVDIVLLVTGLLITVLGLSLFGRYVLRTSFLF